MKFISCRAEAGKDELYSLEQCVLGAYAADGGMFLPVTLPQLTRETLAAWSGLSFQQLVLEFMSLFILPEEVSRTELERLIARAFAKFQRRQPDGSLVTDEIGFHALDSDSDLGSDCNSHSDSSHSDSGAAAAPMRPVIVAELWHGQTLAFKDLPLQFLGQLLSHFVSRRGRPINVLVGTSGDTGSAAIEAVAHSPLVDIFVLFPSGGRITAIQELQMTTAAAAAPLRNVHVCAVDGSSDDLDVPILRLFERDPSFAREFALCSINSVNVVRILMQCAHFVYAYLRVCPSADRRLVDFALPTGAAGHLAAGVLVKQMGLPIGSLCAANNANDLVATFLSSGRFYPRADGALPTSSPAIDIQVPYNIERILYLMHTGSHLDKAARVRSCMRALADPTTRGFQIDEAERARWAAFGLCGAAVSHTEVLCAIRDAWNAQQYLLDPHTGVAVHAARRLPVRCGVLHTDSRVVVFATAHAAKFLPTVQEATGLDEQRLRYLFSTSPYVNVSRAMTLHTLPASSVPFAQGQDWEAMLRQLVRTASLRHSRAQQQTATTGNIASKL